MRMSYYVDKGNVYRINPENGKSELIFEPSDYSSFSDVPISDKNVSELSTIVREFSVQKDNAYIHLQKRSKDDSASIGWRQGYVLRGGTLLKKDLKTSDVEIMYTY